MVSYVREFNELSQRSAKHTNAGNFARKHTVCREGVP